MDSNSHPATVSHAAAVVIIASVAAIWGLGFPMTRFALDGGISVGALMSLRFMLAGVLMFAVIRAKRIAIVRRGVLDGIWLGLILAVIFWSQTDGMRFTTTAKSGFITGLYVLFTPLIAVAIGQRIKLSSAIGAVIATFGLYLLVRSPSGGYAALGGFGQVNRGDLETLVCAILCAVHIIMMGAFARRTDAWLLAGTQVLVGGLISVVVTAFLPAPYRLPEPCANSAAHHRVWPDDLPRAVFHHLCLLGTGGGADAPGPDRGRFALQHRTGDRGDPQRPVAEGSDDRAAGARAARSSSRL